MNAGDAESEEEAYLKFRRPYVTSAVAWALSFYKEANPDWELEVKKIPLIVDVGCGSGQLSAPLSEYCDRLIAVDISPSHLELANIINDRDNVEYFCGDALNLSDFCPCGGVDLVVCAMSAHYFASDEFYSQVKRCLRPGGVLFLFGCWYPGFQHVNYTMRNALTDFWMMESANSKVMSRNEMLMNFYEDLYYPIENFSSRSGRVNSKVTREDIRNLLTGDRHLLKNRDQSIEKFLKIISANDRLDLICDMFALQAVLNVT